MKDESEDSAATGDPRKTQRLSAVAIYDVIREDGIEEMNRPTVSLIYSGLAAGVGISTAFLAMGVLYHLFEGSPYVDAIMPFGYAIGFILVILGRMQLFTENTITPILPFFYTPSWDMAWCIFRLWMIVLFANLAGTTMTSLVTQTLQTVPPEMMAAMTEIAGKTLEKTPWQSFAYGIPAGFLVAGIVWMMPLSKGFEIATIGIFAWLLAAAGLAHVIVDSGKLTWLMFEGQVGPIKVVFGHILPTLLGNIIGGTGLFAILAWGQVKSEV